MRGNIIILFFSLACVIAVSVWVLIKIRQKKKEGDQPVAPTQKTPASSLVEDFSGDNHCDTELDLAKAYLELHQYEKTKQLLKSVITHGAPHQILEARKMFTQLLKQERLT